MKFEKIILFISLLTERRNESKRKVILMQCDPSIAINIFTFQKLIQNAHSCNQFQGFYYSRPSTGYHLTQFNELLCVDSLRLNSSRFIPNKIPSLLQFYILIRNLHIDKVLLFIEFFFVLLCS